VVADSPLAIRCGAADAGGERGGWVEVDPRTAQHLRHPNVFAIGDVGSFPTAKTAAAVRRQAPVVAANVVAVLEGRPLDPDYDGYSACPLITSDHAVMMVEFDYRRKPVSSFLVNPVKERWFTWLLERYGFPWIYWNRMPRGLPHEGACLRPLEGWARRLGLMRWQHD
jgi:sulfide:quinone oxidoreductase